MVDACLSNLVRLSACTRTDHQLRSTLCIGSSDPMANRAKGEIDTADQLHAVID